MSEMIQWVAVHAHSNGTDAHLFLAPFDLYQQVPDLQETEIQQAFVQDFLPRLDFVPEAGETLEFCPVTRTAAHPTSADLKRLVAKLPTG